RARNLRQKIFWEVVWSHAADDDERIATIEEIGDEDFVSRWNDELRCELACRTVQRDDRDRNNVSARINRFDLNGGRGVRDGAFARAVCDGIEACLEGAGQPCDLVRDVLI